MMAGARIPSAAAPGAGPSGISATTTGKTSNNKAANKTLTKAQTKQVYINSLREFLVLMRPIVRANNALKNHLLQLGYENLKGLKNDMTEAGSLLEAMGRAHNPFDSAQVARADEILSAHEELMAAARAHATIPRPPITPLGAHGHGAAGIGESLV